MNDQAVYYSEDRYNAYVATTKRIHNLVPSLKIQPSAWTGTVTDDEIKIALGEQLNIWPESILDHVEVAA